LIYRDQINKTANAIDEIIQGLRIDRNSPAEETSQNRRQVNDFKEERSIPKLWKSGKRSFHKLLSAGIVITLILTAAGIVLHSKIFKHDILTQLRSPDGRISVLVLPFQNMTNDTILNVWQDGIQNELITYLTNFKDLQVRQIESVTGLLRGKGLTDYASLTPSVANDISRKLDANLFINGTIKQAGTTLRINAQLSDSRTEEVLRSFQVNGSTDKILVLIDSLSVMTKNFLILSKLEKEIQSEFRQFVSTNSPEAYRYFILGYNAFYRYDMPASINFFSQAIKIDSNFTAVSIFLGSAFWNQGMDEPDKKFFFDQAKKWTLRVYDKRDQMPLQQKLYTDVLYAMCFETPLESIKCFRQINEIDNQSPHAYFEIGFNYSYLLDQHEKAIPAFEKALEIYNKWGTKPPWILNYELLGRAYYLTGQYEKAENIIRLAEQDFPETASNPFYWELYYWRAIIYLAKRDTANANSYIKKYLKFRRDNSESEAAIMSVLGLIYNKAEMPDSAEKFYRKALFLQPENPYLLNEMAYFLIDHDRKTVEGLMLADKALKVEPDNYSFLHTKGWGLYKQGKYKEALDLLEKSWNLKPIYDHRVYLHLEEVKKAIAGQKL
jgi:tetratricopeptide (TPR) repeat protein